MNTLRRTAAAALLILALFGLSSPAFSHKVNLFTYVAAGKIQVESYFPDGKPVEGGKIEILDSGGRKVSEGLTGKEGKFSAPIPKVDDLTIVIDASMGHKSSVVLKKSELEGKP